MPKPETRLVKSIREALRAKYPQGLFLKIHGNRFQLVGIPDLLCCVKGRFIALEVKTATGKPTIAQLVILDRINKAGGYARIVRSVSEALKAVNKALFPATDR